MDLSNLLVPQVFSRLLTQRLASSMQTVASTRLVGARRAPSKSSTPAPAVVPGSSSSSASRFRNVNAQLRLAPASVALVGLRMQRRSLTTKIGAAVASDASAAEEKWISSQSVTPNNQFLRFGVAAAAVAATNAATPYLAPKARINNKNAGARKF